MTWARLDDKFPRHPKVRRLSDKAFRLHVSAICWCAEMGTDGLVEPDAEPIERKKGLVAELVKARLWVEDPEGWRINGYLEYNPSKAELDSKRHNKRIAGAKGAAIRWGKADANAPSPAQPSPAQPDLVFELTPKEGESEGGGFSHPSGYELTPDQAYLLETLDERWRNELVPVLVRGASDYSPEIVTEGFRAFCAMVRDAGVTPTNAPGLLTWHIADQAQIAGAS